MPEANLSDARHVAAVAGTYRSRVERPAENVFVVHVPDNMAEVRLTLEGGTWRARVTCSDGGDVIADVSVPHADDVRVALGAALAAADWIRADLDDVPPV